MVMNPFRNRIQYIVERLLLSGTLSRLAVAAVVIFLVAVAAGVVGFLAAKGSGEAFDHPFEAIWWAFLRLTDPGYLGDDEGLALRVVSTVVTIAGYVLFLGVLIAILTQGLNEWIERLEKGLSPISAKNHVIFLGWTHRMPEIVRNMLIARQSVLDFLRSVGAKRLKLVLLVDEVTATHTTELRHYIGSDWKAQQVILRSGTPLRLDHLQRVDYLRASAIVLPAENRGPGRSSSLSDNSAVKTILSISRSLNALRPDQRPPLLVAELFDARKTPIALNSYSGPIEVIAVDQVVSRMVSQMTRHAQISRIYRELLTHGLGNEIFVRTCPQLLIGQSFWTVAAAQNEAVLMGVTRLVDGAIRLSLNPPVDFQLSKGDRLVCIARTADFAMTPNTFAAAVEWPQPEHSLTVQQRPDLKLLILGWSRWTPALLEELESYHNQHFDVTIASTVPVAERLQRIEHYGATFERVSLQHLNVDYTVPGPLARLQPGDYDVVLCLASDMANSVPDADARTLVAYALLNDLFHKSSSTKRPRVLLELLDELNVALIDPATCEYQLSPQVSSHMLAQVALQRELNAVFQELFNSGETEIIFRDPHRYDIPAGKHISFAGMAIAARRHNEIALGYSKAEEYAEAGGGIYLNPPRNLKIELAADDQLIVLRSGTPK